jgi:hypothetical protein
MNIFSHVSGPRARTRRDAETPATVAQTRHVAGVVRGHGYAIATVLRSENGAQLVGLDRGPLRVGPFTDRLRDIAAEHPRTTFTIDAEGLGQASWGLLFPGVRGPRVRRWKLYTGRGEERRKLTDVLIVAVARHSFAVVPDLKERDALERALLDATRDPKEDGPGSEVAIALALALRDRPPGQLRVY